MAGFGGPTFEVCSYGVHEVVIIEFGLSVPTQGADLGEGCVYGVGHVEAPVELGGAFGYRQIADR